MNPSKKLKIVEDIGKVMIDVGKLVLGSIALGGILRGNIEPFFLLLAGFASSATLIVGGLVLLAMSKE
ncbi:MAG: hypothetical protein LBR23_01980 [Spirochaetaceae bacterium]|jgi:hypothetical protein|nr:hypothetical protein [Spirochaetaceae bacterium]